MSNKLHHLYKSDLLDLFFNIKERLPLTNIDGKLYHSSYFVHFQSNEYLIESLSLNYSNLPGACNSSHINSPEG